MIPCYEATTCNIYRNESGDLREKQTRCVYAADTVEQALIDGLRWAKQMFLQLGDFDDLLYVGCVQIHTYCIHPIDADNYCRTGINGLGRILEWKCDTWLYRPKNPDPKVVKLIEEIKALRKEDWQKHWKRTPT